VGSWAFSRLEARTCHWILRCRLRGLSFMLEDTAAPVVLTRPHCATDCRVCRANGIAGCGLAHIAREGQEDLASRSAREPRLRDLHLGLHGQPKGVVVPHVRW